MQIFALKASSGSDGKKGFSLTFPLLVGSKDRQLC
jgi:hypothetical protein